MSTTGKGKSPHLYYIFGKTEIMGQEFKNIACYVNGNLLFIDIQIGPPAAWSNVSLYNDNDGSDKGDRSYGHKRGHKGLFSL